MLPAGRPAASSGSLSVGIPGPPATVRRSLPAGLRWLILTENRIGPGWMAQESDEAKATHADRVTAICVANHARRFSGQSRIVAPKPPKGSVARQIMEEQEMESSRQKW